MLPNTPVAGLPYLGFGLEELEPDDDWGDITFTLVSAVNLSDPTALFAIWNYDDFGQPVIQATPGGPDSDIVMQAGGHDHYAWGFGAAGDLDITFTVSGAQGDGPTLSDTATFRFQIVPEPSSALLGVLGAGVLVLRRRR